MLDENTLQAMQDPSELNTQLPVEEPFSQEIRSFLSFKYPIPGFEFSDDDAFDLALQTLGPKHGTLVIDDGLNIELTRTLHVPDGMRIVSQAAAASSGTTICCSGDESLIDLGSADLLQGLRFIQRGSAGSAVLISGSGTTIDECDFENTETATGTMLVLGNSSEVIQDCYFTNLGQLAYCWGVKSSVQANTSSIIIGGWAYGPGRGGWIGDLASGEVNDFEVDGWDCITTGATQVEARSVSNLMVEGGIYDQSTDTAFLLGSGPYGCGNAVLSDAYISTAGNLATGVAINAAPTGGIGTKSLSIMGCQICATSVAVLVNDATSGLSVVSTAFNDNVIAFMGKSLPPQLTLLCNPGGTTTSGLRLDTTVTPSDNNTNGSQHLQSCAGALASITSWVSPSSCDSALALFNTLPKDSNFLTFTDFKHDLSGDILTDDEAFAKAVNYFCKFGGTLYLDHAITIRLTGSIRASGSIQLVSDGTATIEACGSFDLFIMTAVQRVVVKGINFQHDGSFGSCVILSGNNSILENCNFSNKAGNASSMVVIDGPNELLENSIFVNRSSNAYCWAANYLEGSVNINSAVRGGSATGIGMGGFIGSATTAGRVEGFEVENWNCKTTGSVQLRCTDVFGLHVTGGTYTGAQQAGIQLGGGVLGCLDVVISGATISGGQGSQDEVGIDAAPSDGAGLNCLAVYGCKLEGLGLGLTANTYCGSLAIYNNIISSQIIGLKIQAPVANIDVTGNTICSPLVLQATDAGATWARQLYANNIFVGSLYITATLTSNIQLVDDVVTFQGSDRTVLSNLIPERTLENGVTKGNSSGGTQTVGGIAIAISPEFLHRKDTVQLASVAGEIRRANAQGLRNAIVFSGLNIADRSDVQAFVLQLAAANAFPTQWVIDGLFQNSQGSFPNVESYSDCSASENGSDENLIVGAWLMDHACVTQFRMDGSIQVQQADCSVIATFEFSPDGSVARISNVSGAKATYSYDAAGLLSGLQGSDLNISVEKGCSTTVTGDSNALVVEGGGYAGLVGNNNTAVGAAGASINIAGDHDSVTVGVGSYVGVVSGVEAVIHEDQSITATLNGVNVSVIGCLNRFVGGEGVLVSFNGDSNNVSVGANSTLRQTGIGNSLRSAVSSRVTIVGDTNDLAAGSSAVVAAVGDGNTIAVGGGSAVDLAGDRVHVSVDPRSYVGVVRGVDVIVDADASTICTLNGTAVNVGGSNNLISGGAAGIYQSSGNHNVITVGVNSYLGAIGDGTLITSAMGSQINVNGNDVVVAADYDSYVGIAGGSAAITLDLGCVIMLDNIKAEITGNEDSITTGTNCHVKTFGNTNIISVGSGTYLGVAGDENVIYGSAQSRVDIAGDDVQVQVGTGSAVGLVRGVNASVAGSSISVVTLNGIYAVVTGSGNSFYGGGNGHFDIVGNTNAVFLGRSSYVGILGNGNQVTASANAIVDVAGSDNILALGDGGQIGLVRGTNLTVSANNGSIATLDDVQATIYGSSDVLVTGVGGTFQLVGNMNLVAAGAGTNLHLVGELNQVAANYDSTLSVTGHGNTITIGAGSSVQVFGSANTVTVGSGSSVLLGLDGGPVGLENTITSGDGSNTFIVAGNAVLDCSSANSDTVLVGATGNLTVNTKSAALSLTNRGGTVSIHETGAGDDSRVTLSGGDELVTGGAGLGLTVTTGASGSSRVTLDSGNSTIHSNGYDLVQGGAGAMTFIGGSLSSTIVAGSGALLITAGTGNLIVQGSNAGDTFHAGTGMATFTEGSGDDVVFLGAGNAQVIGGGGSSLYHLVAGSGGQSIDIHNFEVGRDHIDFSGFGSSPISNQVVANGSLTMSLSNGTIVTLDGVTKAM